MKKYMLLYFCFSYLSFSVFTQSYDVFSMAGNHLLKIDPLDASVIESIAISNLPAGETIRSLTYSSVDKVMYGLVSLTTIPSLVKLEPDGTMTIIGNLSIPNETVFLAEGLAYNETDNKLYGAVSLNGGISGNDFFSETLIEIDPVTAQSSIVAQIAFSAGSPDVDNMTFDNNRLIIHDGLPGDNRNDFYIIDFGNINNPAQAVLGFSTSPYTPIGDMEKLNCSNSLLIVEEFDVLRLNIDLQQLTLIGSTHDMTQFGGAPLQALTDIPSDALIPLSLGDTTLCTGDTVTLTARNQALEVNWNTGEEAMAIQITEPGMYFGTVSVNACEVPTDTVNISTEDCEDCADLRTMIASSLLLGNDTTLCLNQSLELAILIPDAEVVWSTGDNNPSLNIDQGGDYWATVRLNDCSFLTDTITVGFTSCDGCDALKMELARDLQLGRDTTICVNDTITLSVDIMSADIRWNTGLASSEIEVNVPGVYWAEVGIGGCIFPTDTIRVGTLDCLECNLYVPNVFSPDGNSVNDVFQVFVDETTCQLQEIEMLIFNRWGALVYEGRQNRWNGKTHNGLAERGLYVYLIKMKLLREGQLIELQKSGDVLLLNAN